MPQPGVRLACDALSERLGQSRFPDPRLGCDQHDAPGTRLCLLPTAPQQFELLLAADERRFARAQRLEPAADPAFANHPEGWDRRRQAFELDLAEALILEQVAGPAPGT